MTEQIISNDILMSMAVAVGGSTLAIFGWSMYSSRRRSSLKKGDFAKMEILSETREESGDSSKIPDIARRFSLRGSFQTLRRSFVHIGGHKFDSTESKRSSIRVKGDVAFQYTEDGEKWEIHGRRKPSNLSLRELVAKKSTMIEIEEDLYERMNWNDRIDKCKPMKQGEVGNRPKIKGSYSFCYRDYVNHEELMGMMWKRGGIEAFLFKPARAGVITVDEDSKCVLTERSKLFYFIPICITWEGILKNCAIEWTTTSMMLGWERFGKVFDKPAVAERLRKAHWHILIPEDDSTGDILCFGREGKGHLVFAKEACLAKGNKAQ